MNVLKSLNGAASTCALLVLAACTAAPQPRADVGARPEPHAGASPGVAADGPTVVHAGAPGEESRARPAADVTAAGRPRHVDADVRFMQDMIAHHRQAVEMTALVPQRAGSASIRTLARRIEVSQDDEILLMRHWLDARGAAVPDGHAHHGHHAGHGAHGGPATAHDMPGMLTDAQLARLAAASGAEFDRLFLEFMIFHHEGALVMVADLFAAEGAGQETEIFQFASHVDSDQRMEIDRMRRLLSTLQ
jgi:uncharacterized protein (DUF305 family)